MDTQFNVFEVLQIVEEVEHRAARFYLKAAERLGDPSLRRICYDLASRRVRNKQIWTHLRNEYSERTEESGTLDPDNYVRSNPQVMAGLPRSGVGLSLRNWPTGYESGTQIARDAIRRTEDVRIFYHGLKEFACDRASRDMIDAMIGEEDRHIRQLNRTLDEMLGSADRLKRPVSCDSVCVASCD